MMDKLLLKMIGILLGILLSKKTKELLNKLQPGGNYTMKCTWSVKNALFEVIVNENIKLEQPMALPQLNPGDKGYAENYLMAMQAAKPTTTDVKTVQLGSIKFGIDENSGSTEMDTDEFKTIHSTFLDDAKDFREAIAKPAMVLLDKIIDKGDAILNKFVDSNLRRAEAAPAEPK